MKAKVYAIATNITSALGLDTKAHWAAVSAGRVGVAEHTDATYSNAPFWASRIDAAMWQRIQAEVKSAQVLSPFEQLCIFSAKQALRSIEQQLDAKDTIIILSTTKGNIEWLEQAPDERLLLSTSANIIAKELGYETHKPMVISHACVSGVLATVYAQRMLQAGRYKHAIIIGCDRFSKFVLNGFQSFHAIDNKACRPFDVERHGINLGEAGATVILTTQPEEAPLATILGGSSSNDANHISGPSRTGEELALAINNALSEAGVKATDINMVSAHGTATLYNDEMESKAIGVTGMQDVPLHSMKGYCGHTLGAAGVLESAMIIESLQHQQLIPSAGYESLGVPVAINVTTTQQPADIKYVLKMASGFGGSNATAVWGRV